MIGSVGSGSVSSMLDPKARTAGGNEKAAGRTVADHVAEAEAEADPAEPIRSVSATLGTLVDTYL